MTPRPTALAEALRAWRDRAGAGATAPPKRSRRQVPGLRREELAQLAGVSVDYLIRLEQGRAVNPSPPVLDALADALRLGADERRTLYALAGVAPRPRGAMPRDVPLAVQRLVDHLADTPVAVCTPAWDLLRVNPLYAALFGDPAAWSPRERNLVWRQFHGAGKWVHPNADDRDGYQRELVSDLRLATNAYPEDAGLMDLVRALRDLPDFAADWDRFEVRPRTSGRNTAQHDAIGFITLDCNIVTLAADDLKMLIMTAVPDTADALKLQFLQQPTVQHPTERPAAGTPERHAPPNL